MRNTTVLIVEDNADAKEVFVSALRAHGYSTVEASNGCEALERLDETQVEIILTDLRMPLMDGLQLAAKVRQMAAHAHIPMILLTATPMANKYAMLKEFSAVLLKPCSVDELLSTVDSFA